MTAKTVITAVRNRLGDSQVERWDNETLLLYVSLCQNDICMFTNFYRKHTTIQLMLDQYIYPLPTDCLNVHRLEFHDELLPVETRNNIDSNDASFPCVLFDNLAFNNIEFVVGESYTTLEQALRSVYGVVSSGPDLIDPADDLGVLVEPDGIGGELVDDFGVVIAEEEGCVLADIHGVLSDIDCDLVDKPPQPFDEVLVYYTAIPEILEMVPPLVEDEEPTLPIEDLLLPDIWFQAFLHYVCGMALQDDNDANNIQRGELEGSKYLRVLAHIQKTAAKDFTSNIRTKLTTNMRRI